MEPVAEPSEIINISSESLAEYYNKAQNVQIIKSELTEDFEINLVQTEPVQ